MGFFKITFAPSHVFLKPSYGCKAIKITKDDVLFFGGGCNGYIKDVVLYNIPKNSYQKFSLNSENQEDTEESNEYAVQEESFLGLAAHDMVYLKNKKSVLIFGGMTDLRVFTNNLYLLENFADLYTVQDIGDVPSPRIGHTLTKINDSLVILFGGVENVSRSKNIVPNFLNEVYVLHIEDDIFRWKKIETSKNQPCGRESHSAVFFDNHIIIYGGNNGTKRLNDTWMLNILTFEWTNAHTSGSNPLARSMHSASLVDDKMYIFGGFVQADKHSNKSKATNSMQCLDLNTKKWKCFTLGTKPDPRAGHAAIEYYGRILIWSGRDDNNLQENMMCLNDAWFFETKKPLKVTQVNVVSYDKNSFKLEWMASVNAIFYVVELKKLEIDCTKVETMIVDDESDEVVCTEEHPLNVVVVKSEKKKEPKIIIHENKILLPPHTIDVEALLKCGTVKFKEYIEQFDGTSDTQISETDSEFETFLAKNTNNLTIARTSWHLVGIFKETTCNVKNYSSHVLNRLKLSSNNIPNLIGSKQIELNPGDTYLIRVSALNSCGVSEGSELIKVKIRENEPIYDVQFENINEHPILKWSTTLKNVEFLVTFESYEENFSTTNTIYKGTSGHCAIPRNLFEKLCSSDQNIIYIRAIANGQVIHGTELRYSPDML